MARWAFWAVLVVILGSATFVGLRALGVTDPSYGLECPAPVLAAGEAVPVALSCQDLLTYQGRRYSVGCAPVHATRLGERFQDDGGETGFDGARDLVGLARADVFGLEGVRYCRGKEVPIAASDDFSRLDAGLLRVPVGTSNEMEKARRLAPWVIPARNEYPHALRLDAELSAEAITVTNRNSYSWRKCDQVQIGDDIDAWETGDYLDGLKPDVSHEWSLSDFDRDSGGIEQLDADHLDDIRGEPLIIMCRASRGLAIGEAILQ